MRHLVPVALSVFLSACLSVPSCPSRRRRRRPISRRRPSSVRPSRRRRPSAVRPSSVRPSRGPSNYYLQDVA